MKSDIVLVCLEEGTVLYDIIKEENKSFDSKYINLLQCTNFIVKKNPDEKSNNFGRNSLNKSNINKSNAVSKKQSNVSKTLKPLINVKGSSLSLSMNNVFSLPFQNTDQNRQNSNRDKDNQSQSIMNSTINQQSQNLINTYSSEFDSENEKEVSGFDYEFTKIILIGTSDKSSEIFIQSLINISDSDKKIGMNRDFELICSFIKL